MLKQFRIKCIERKLMKNLMSSYNKALKIYPWCTTSLPVNYHENLNSMFYPLKDYFKVGLTVSSGHYSKIIANGLIKLALMVSRLSMLQQYM